MERKPLPVDLIGPCLPPAVGTRKMWEAGLKPRQRLATDNHLA